MLLGRGGDGRLAVLFNRSEHEVAFHLPARPGHHWPGNVHGRRLLGPRSVAFAAEAPGPAPRHRGHDRAAAP